MGTNSIAWNDHLRLAISDVDETIADVHSVAEPAMIDELSAYLADGGKLFMASGGWLKHIRTNIIDHINPELRQNILVAHCSGSEVWGFDENGEVRPEPFLSAYEAAFTPEMKQSWRSLVEQLIQEFGFRVHNSQPKLQFKQKVGSDPHDIMFEDRGSQITLMLINAFDLSDEQYALIEREVPFTHGQRDLRIPVIERAEELLAEAGLPITPRMAGTTAIDMAARGVSKTTAIQHVLERPEILKTIGLIPEDVHNPAQTIEVWGDRFSALRGGTDRHISEALPPQVRSIDFRKEDPREFPEDYNIVVWDGQQELYRGLLEYLRSRPRK